MYKPHLRLTWSGTLPDGEIWSNNLSLVPDGSEWEALFAGAVAPYIAALNTLLVNINLTDDLVADVVAYHTRADSFISTDAVLKRITVAAIDDNGHYSAAPREAAVNVGGSRAASRMPHQISRKITLETDSDLGRVKGGWYQPLPSVEGFDYSTDLWAVAQTTQVRDSVKTFLDNLQDAPGLDFNSFRVVVASQGRHNKNGTVRQGPGNFDVKRVNVGRRADVQRRRANKLSEARIADATLA